MCKYAEENPDGHLVCKPFSSYCTFCIRGNKSRYEQIKEVEELSKREGRTHGE